MIDLRGLGADTIAMATHLGVALTAGQAQRLVQTWNRHGDVLEFRITPT
jgi:hypothetical protein